MIEIKVDCFIYNIYRGLYKIALPLFFTIVLFIISGNIQRTDSSGSSFFELFLRLWIVVLFSVTYFALPDFAKIQEKYYGSSVIKHWKEDKWGIVINFFINSLAAVMVVVITNWIIEVFLPVFNRLALYFSVVNSIIIFIPMNFSFKKKVANQS